MDAPQLEGLEMRHLAGTGGCGRVYLAEDAAGEKLAVKVFDGLAIQRGLLAKMTGRLSEGDWPPGALPILTADYESRPAFQITPWLADGEPQDGALPVPRTLQNRLGGFPSEASWPVIHALAAALATLHERRVAHGNLKPGNVFFSDTGELLVADWALGNMPGVGRFEFTDAVLYQPPEQLLDPRGYADETGYRWDVFAFGALAFRLLTGKFPRCHEMFASVAPAPGESLRDGIHADLPKIARGLEASPEVTWPTEPSDATEAGFRTCLNRCLALDPRERPATMLEVVAEFEMVTAEVAKAREQEHLLDLRRRAERRARQALAAVGGLIVVVIALRYAWQSSRAELRVERQQRGEERLAMGKEIAQEIEMRKAADQRAATQQEASNQAAKRLAESRRIGDQLFSWAMEKGHRQLPPLDGREPRLNQLKRYFEDFLTRTADVAELADERTRAKLQLAEIALSAGDAEAAETHLSAVIAAWQGQPQEPELALRLATDRLLLALVRQAAGAPTAGAAFADARQAFADLPEASDHGIAPDRIAQLVAIMDFREAELLAANGKDQQSVEFFLRAIAKLNQLTDQRPDAAVAKSELADCQLAAATVFEGMGRLVDAREARASAATRLTQLLKKDPKNFSFRLELAGCYSAMAEAAILTGEAKSADTFSKDALKLLQTLVAEKPDDREAAVRLAAQIGIGAGLLSDRGQAKEASLAYDEGINLLEKLRTAQPDEAMVCYRLGLLWWQKGRTLGSANPPAEKIRLLSEARDLLLKLESERPPGSPPLEPLRRALAYLLGDLAHALQLTGQRADAEKAFGDAVGFWAQLLAVRPNSEEYEEGHAWCRQRLQELNRKEQPPADPGKR